MPEKPRHWPLPCGSTTRNSTGGASRASCGRDLLGRSTAGALEPPVVRNPLRGEHVRLTIPGWDLDAIHTPGHTAGHIVLRSEREGVILTGDHVLPHISPGVGLGGRTSGNPVDDYVDSLRRVAVFADDEALPGHGYRFRGLAARCDALRVRQERRTAEVALIAERNPSASVWQTASRLRWSSPWSTLAGVHLTAALGQTAMHLDRATRGRAIPLTTPEETP